jgi:hypothetical protein
MEDIREVEEKDYTGCEGDVCKNLKCENPFCTFTQIPNFHNIEQILEIVLEKISTGLENPEAFIGHLGSIES